MAEEKEARMDKSRGTRGRGASMSRGFNVKDGMEAGDVRSISANSEQYDLDRIRKYTCGSKGYPSQAF